MIFQKSAALTGCQKFKKDDLAPYRLPFTYT